MHQPTRLIKDSSDRYKLKVSLPGGQYQLSLDDQAVIVLIDELGLSVRDTVPDAFVPFFVATGDAWFPSQRDTEAVIDDLPSDSTLTSQEHSVLLSYITENRIAARNEDIVKTALENSPISNDVTFSELDIQPLPELPDMLLNAASSEPQPEDHPKDSISDSESEPSEQQAEHDETQSQSQPDSKENTVKALQEIPGIGPNRAEKLVSGGVQSIAALADSRPIEVQKIEGISEGLAMVAIEGAREFVGDTTPAENRLKNQTNVTEDVFDPVLSSLASAGIPASEAMSTLRVLYGPTVADIGAVSGHQAYFLWESGYQTPQDIVEASTEELEDVYQVGAETAPEIQESAENLLNSGGSYSLNE